MWDVEGRKESRTVAPSSSAPSHGRTCSQARCSLGRSPRLRLRAGPIPRAHDDVLLKDFSTARRLCPLKYPACPPCIPHSPPATSAMPMNTLPPEIWLLVKDSIPLSDMRTHVSFYQAASRFAALYDTVADPDAFWEDVCTMCAIGRFPDEHPSVRSWKDIAVECITVDGFCEGSSKHPCGEVLLQRNRELLCPPFA